MKVCHAHLELASRSYPLWGTIPYITAFAGTIAVCILSLIIEKSTSGQLQNMEKILCDFGRNGLTIFLIHYFDCLIKPLWSISGWSAINAVCRVIVDLTIYSVFRLVTKKYKR